MNKTILYDANDIIARVESGDEVLVGRYKAYNRTIEPSDKLIYDKDRGFVQVGVERKGCDFIISELDIQYTVKDAKCIIETGKNQMGGNVALVFFES